jgi:acetoacetyl-CoA synthetase
VWEYFDIDADTPYGRVLAEEIMPGARWFPGATLNYAHHALRKLPSDGPAIIALPNTPHAIVAFLAATAAGSL